MTYDIGNPDPCLGLAQKRGGLNRLMGFKPSPVDTYVSQKN